MLRAKETYPLKEAGGLSKVRQESQAVADTASSPCAAASRTLTWWKKTRDSSISAIWTHDLLAPGHPLLGALVDAVEAEYGDVLTQGVLLEDDRESDDYTLVTLELETPDDQFGSLVTVRLRPGQQPQRVDPAFYTDLAASHLAGTSDEAAVATQAVADAVGSIAPRSARVRAVAHVRGTASAEDAHAWQARCLVIAVSSAATSHQGSRRMFTRAAAGRGVSPTGDGAPE